MWIVAVNFVTRILLRPHAGRGRRLRQSSEFLRLASANNCGRGEAGGAIPYTELAVTLTVVIGIHCFIACGDPIQVKNDKNIHISFTNY